ncbi:MAG: glyoxalase, partial [Verrucomicrobiota bacterium]
MDTLTATGIKVFLPAKDFALSTTFYQELGFKLTLDLPAVKEFTLNGCKFLLQDFYQEELAKNLMLQLWVDDLDGWWSHILELKLVERYPGIMAKEPTDYPWGLREINLS